MSFRKKSRTVWLLDADYKKLRSKAAELFSGKGYLERFLEKIANENVIFIKGSGRFEIKSL